MSREYRSCECMMEFGGKERLFKLPLKQIAELQERCGAGIGTIYKRLLTGEFDIFFLIEIVRQGLIGGGMPAGEANRLVDRHYEMGGIGGLQGWYEDASRIIGVAFHGYDDGSAKKKAVATETSSSSSQKPTETQPS